MRWLTDLVYLAIGLFYLPVALYHALFLGKNRHGWRHRFGGVPRFDPTRRRIWIHAVSLGEINATPKLAELLGEQSRNTEIVFSTTTDTGFARAVQLYGSDRVFRFPLDFSWVVKRALDRIRPSIIVLVELEVWPNLVALATQRRIPVAVVNGRLTERSARRLGWLGSTVRQMFAPLAWVGAQDETIAARFRGLGVAADRVEVTASLKWDTTVVAVRVEGQETLARELDIDHRRPLWVCGSTGPGEEEVILEAYQAIFKSRNRSARIVQEERREVPDAVSVSVSGIGAVCDASTALPRTSKPDKTRGGGSPGAKALNSDRAFSSQPLLAVVPRKPERFDDVARMIERAGFRCIRRSCPGDNDARGKLDDQSVILGDTMGELRKLYSLADVVFVGRSLVPMGGSDPMEVAALGKPIIAGPHMENFAEPTRVLQEAGCIRAADSSISLAAAVMEILANPQLAASMGRSAREVVLEHQGATRRTTDRLISLLNSRRGP